MFKNTYIQIWHLDLGMNVELCRNFKVPCWKSIKSKQMQYTLIHWPFILYTHWLPWLPTIKGVSQQFNGKNISYNFSCTETDTQYLWTYTGLTAVLLFIDLESPKINIFPRFTRKWLMRRCGMFTMVHNGHHALYRSLAQMEIQQNNLILFTVVMKL